MRPSHDTREEAVAALRRGYLAGRLGTETFARRVDEALHSSDHAELGSSNGTWVNGRRVVEAEVRPGDTLHLGGCQLRL